MFAVIFEIQPKQGRWDEYLALAKNLKPKLEAIDGFIDNERFASKRTEGRLLSLSTWRDEKAVVRWRTQGEHHAVQKKGRFEVFDNYHLRVGEITADDAPPQGLAITETRFDETETGEAKICTITEVSPPPPDRILAWLRLDPRAPGLADHEVFESIYNPGKLLILASWRDDVGLWRPETSGKIRHRRVRIVRDYGMFDRREAPQFYPDVGTSPP